MNSNTFVSAIKRNGEKVPYNPQKIAIAMRKAFDASGEVIDEQGMQNLVSDIEHRLLKITNGASSIHIEQIQDLIEWILMKNEYFATAKGFIIYRQAHAERRLTKTLSQRDKFHAIKIVKRDGTKNHFNLSKALSTLRNASKGVNSHYAPLDPILMELEKNVYEGISTSDLYEALILSTTAFIERDPGYDVIAARLLTQKLYKEVINEKIPTDTNFKQGLEEHYKKQFISSIKDGVSYGYFDTQLLDFDLEALSKELIISQDSLLAYLGLRTLYDRYFVKHEGLCLETPQIFWMRVAMGLSIKEKDKHESAVRFYKLISELRYIPSTPTLFHAGLVHPQLSSCYISTVSDDLGNIFKCIGDNAQLSKWSGGIGNDWSSVRATNSLIKSTNVESQGVIPFLKIANDTTLAINRSGKRRGATCAYLETWHLDIEDFVDLRKNTGDDRRRTHDMNIAVWIPDLFMKRVEAKQHWTLFSPNETPDLHEIYGAEFENRYVVYEKMAAEGEIRNFKTIEAVKLWRRIITRLFETGHPWITFKDPCNIRSPQDHAGVVHSSNLCTEITLNNSKDETAVCNLGSINLKAHVTQDGINQYLLKDTVKTAMRILDNVIDINFYPTIEAKNSNMKHRPVGLGMMGVQDALYTLRLPFTGEATIDFMDKTMEFISYHAILSSSELAKERGAYESFKGSKWDRGLLPFDTIALLEKERNQSINVNRNTSLDWDVVREHIKEHGMRNSNTMAIAPTATISNIAGCSPCTEPIYKNIYVKSNMTGEFTIINKYLINELKELGLWNSKMLNDIKYFDGNISYIEEIPQDIKMLYKETFDIDSVDLLKLTAVRAKWIDQSQSHNIFNKEPSGKKLSDIYFQAWKMGLKTTYYLRSLGASQIEKSTLNAKEYGYTQKRDYKALGSQAEGQTEGQEQKEHRTKSETQNTTIVNTAVAKVTRDASSYEHTQESLKKKAIATDLLVDERVLNEKVLDDKEEIPAQASTLQNNKANNDDMDFELDEQNAASVVKNVCSLLDPDCESCQ